MRIIKCILGIFLFTTLTSVYAVTPMVPGDPFGALQTSPNPNCGTVSRLKFDVTINSANDFVNFIKNNQAKLGEWVRLDNFKNSTTQNVDWNKVLASVTTGSIGGNTVYILNYNPVTCSGFTLKMTSNGYVSNYGCCGV